MSDPRIIIAVMIDEPTGLYHYGGDVAAPTFATLAASALRSLKCNARLNDYQHHHPNRRCAGEYVIADMQKTDQVIAACVGWLGQFVRPEPSLKTAGGAHAHHPHHFHGQPLPVRLCADSRQIHAGDIFFAYPGDIGDGRQYIAAAIAAGAQAVVLDDRNFESEELSVPVFKVTDLKLLAGYIASAHYRHADAEMFTAAVTGTNGKTSCALWLARALARPGAPSGVIGTLGVGLLHASRAKHEVEFDATGFTTPDAVLLQEKLQELHIAGAQALAIEASSIGLVQGRMNGMHIDAAVFTEFDA